MSAPNFNVGGIRDVYDVMYLIAELVAHRELLRKYAPSCWEPDEILKITDSLEKVSGRYTYLDEIEAHRAAVSEREQRRRAEQERQRLERFDPDGPHAHAQRVEVERRRKAAEAELRSKIDSLQSRLQHLDREVDE